jgi:D-glycero-alpha-D-manno-heptose-7-phosphate kinase
MTPMATSSKIDGLIDSVKSVGAYGAKLCGAGGGGFLMVICDENKQQMVRDVLKGFALELHFKFEDEGSKVIYGS